MFKKVIIFVLLLLITFPAISSLGKPGFFPIHDDIQAMRLLQMDKCIQDLQIPCRWVPDMGYGYGYPQFNYYAPLPYYVMESFHLLGFSIIDSVKIGFGLGLLISAIGMYMLATSFWKSRFAGLTSALFYIYFPYHAVNVYVRGAMGETWAIAMMPFIFYSLYELIIKENKNALIYLALSIFGLATSHNVSTLIFAPFCGVWLLYLLMRRKNDYWSGILRVFIGVFWGIAMSAFFLLPAWFEKKYVHVETITQGYFDYLAHFVGLWQLLFSSFWGYGSSELGDFDGMSLSVGILWWTIPLMVCVVFGLFKRWLEFKKVALLVILGWFALFMIHPKSVFLWQNLEILSYVQFPWRFLGIALFLFSLSAGSVMRIAPNRITVFIILFIAVAGFYSGFFAPIKYLNISDNDKFSGESWIKQQTISIFDYLPIYAKLPPSHQAPPTLISDSEISVIRDEAGSNWREWEVSVKENNSNIKFPVLYFPGWKLLGNQHLISIFADSDTGIINANIDQGNYILRLELRDTPIRKISNILSLFAFVSIFFYKKIKILLWKN